MSMIKTAVSKILNFNNEPSKRTEGQFWYDTNNNVLKRSNGTTYTPISVGDNLISVGSTETLKNVLNNKAEKSELSNYLKKTGDAHLELGYKNTDYNSQAKSPAKLIVGGGYRYDDDFAFVEWWDRFTEITDLGIYIGGEIYDGSPDIDVIDLNRSTGIKIRGNVKIDYSSSYSSQTLINQNTIMIGASSYIGNGIYEITNPVFKVHTDDGITGTFIDNNLATELEDGHIASSKAIKSYVDTLVSNKANVSDVVTLTGDQTISGSKTFNNITIDNLNGNTTDVDGVKISTNTNSIELYAAAYTDENGTPRSDIFTKIDAKKIEISNSTHAYTESIQIDASNIKIFTGEDIRVYINPYDGIQMYRDGGYSTEVAPSGILSQNNFGLSITSGGNHFIATNTGQDAVSQLMGSCNDLFGGTENNFVGYIIGTGLDLESGALSNFKNTSIFSVGYSIDNTTLEQLPEISGSLVDKTISSSSLDTHIPTSKAVYTALQSKADNTNVVHLSGDEVITGNKLFTSSIRFSQDSTALTPYEPGTPPVLIIDNNSNITIDASNVIDVAYYHSYGIISGSNSAGETFSIDGKYGSASFSSLHTGSISGTAVVSTLGTSTTSTKIPTEGAVVTAVKTINTSLANKQDKLQYYTEELYGDGTSHVSINADDVIIGQSNTVIRVTPYPGTEGITINSANGVDGTAIATTIGTSETSAKLPTEGAVVKAISDVKTSLGSALTYEGSVENYSNLPTSLTTSDKGKVYNVVNANGDIPAGTNYAWNGTSWDALGGDLSAYQLKTDNSLTTTSKQIVGAINELNLKIDITTGPTPITSVYTVDSTALKAFITNTQYANVQGKISISPSIDNTGAVYFGQSITDKSQAFPLYPGQIMSFSFTDINTFMCATDTVGNKFNYVVEFGVVNKEPVMDAGIIIRSATGENYRLTPITDENGVPTLELESLAKIDSEQLAKYFEESTPNVKELTLVNGSEESQTVLQDKQGNILYTV